MVMTGPDKMINKWNINKCQMVGLCKKKIIHYNEIMKHNLIYLNTYSILVCCLQVRYLLIKCLVINN